MLIYDGNTYRPVSWSVNQYDELGHNTAAYRSDGTLSEQTWGCCTTQSSTNQSGITVSYSRDDLNRIIATTKEKDGPDLVMSYVYDALGRRLSNTTSAGNLSLTTTSEYDFLGRLKESTDQTGLVTEYQYSSDLKTNTVIQPGNETEITEQYTDGQIKSVTGNAVIPQYFTYGVNDDGTQWTEVRIGRPDSPNWEKTTTDLLGRAIKVERPGFNGVEVSDNFYNGKGQLIRSTTTGQADMLYEYNELGEQIRSGMDIDGNGILDLASMDRISESDTRFITANGYWWQEGIQKVYAENNDKTATITGIQRNRLNGLGVGGLTVENISIDIHGNQTVAQSFIDRANKTQTQIVNVPDSDTDQMTISKNGLRTSSQSTSGITMTYLYDDLERQTTVVDPRVGETKTVYDAVTGRVNFIEDPANNRVSYSYDTTTGRVIAETNALNQSTRFAYNTLGQVTHTWGDSPYPVRYVFDDYSRLHEMHTWRADTDWDTEAFPSIIEGEQDVTIWNYHEATGLLTSKVDASGNSTDYTYGVSGRLDTRTWARTASGLPLMTTYTYDPQTTELINMDYSDNTADVTFAYDRLGRQTTITDALGTRTFDYNGLLQMTAETITGLYNKTITRDYAATGVVGRPSGFNTGANYNMDYAYDTKGRFKSLTWNADGQTGTATYNYLTNSDLLKTLTTDHGAQTTYQYDPKRNLRTQIQNQFNGSLISQYDYQYDALGRRTSVQNQGDAFVVAAFNQYNYNARSELEESTRYQGADINDLSSPMQDEYRQYQYDPIGNRVAITEAVDSGSYTANELNQYTVENVAGGTTNNFNYDDDGNLTEISGNKNVQYMYNAENRLVTAEPITPALNDQKVDFVYDYQGRRIQKQISTWNGSSWILDTEKFFVYDGWNMIEEITTGEPTTYYVWGLDLSQSMQGAGGVGGLVSMIVSGNSYEYFYDGNGNVGQLVNTSNGAIAAHYEYDPFGQAVVSTGSLADINSYRFSTKYWDGEYGVYYYGYRYYDAKVGRWLRRDPLWEQGGLNLSSFLSNDPVTYSDYLGLVKKTVSYVSKSFINGVGSLGSVDNRISLITLGIMDIVLGAADTPDGRLKNLANKVGQLEAFNQNPFTDEKDGKYRLYSRLDVTVDCCGNVLVSKSVKADKQGGKEIGFINGTINLQHSIRRDFLGLSPYSATLKWRSWGRPNLLVEPGMQWAAFRTSVNIWNTGIVKIKCVNSEPIFELDNFTGSKFPSHRLWHDGEMIKNIRQGSFSGLWNAKSWWEPTFVK